MRRVVALLLFVALGACSDSSEDAADVPEDAAPGLDHSPTSSTLDPGGLALEVPDGFFGVPVPAAGFGLAVPEGFQATLLTDDAIEVLRAANVPDTGFVSAALNAADNGALFYAAGLAPDSSVTDVKLDMQPTDDPDAALLQVSSDVASQPELADIEIESDPEAGAVRIRFTSPGPDGTSTRAQGTQFLYRAPDAVWSLIVTSEDAENHDVAADAIGATFVLGE